MLARPKLSEALNHPGKTEVTNRDCLTEHPPGRDPIKILRNRTRKEWRQPSPLRRWCSCSRRCRLLLLCDTRGQGRRQED